MKCIYPVSKHRVVDGNRIPFQHRCGQCMPCRITRKQEVTLRILLEAKLHDYNSFVTLTYNNEQIIAPDGRTIFRWRNGYQSVDKVALRKFIKRLRRRVKFQFRYYAVGEYGDESGREHYHLVLFGYPYVYQEEIEAAWWNGTCQVLPLENGGAGYIAGYTAKKLTRPESIPRKAPEFSISSRGRRQDPDYRFRGGIGYGYCQQIIKNITRDKLNFVGDDYKYLRVAGMLLPLDKYMRDAINKTIGYHKLDKSLGEELCISMKNYYNMNYPEAENDEKARSEIKARQRLARQKRYKKI